MSFLVCLFVLQSVISIDCYQETATVATDCGGLSTGNYASLPGNGAPPGIEFFYVNYSKPLLADNVTWLMKYSVNGTDTINNLTIPTTCFQQDKLKLRIASWASEHANARYNAECYDSSGWQQIISYVSGAEYGWYCALGGYVTLYDGDWNTHAFYNENNGWWTCRPNTQPVLYEEAIYWNMQEGTIPEEPQGDETTSPVSGNSNLALYIFFSIAFILVTIVVFSRDKSRRKKK